MAVYNTVVTICTICFKSMKLYILLAQYVYVFCVGWAPNILMSRVLNRY
jgi:hypothetical protein